jgi:HAD superfamily hydrolase (TIGR01450 family)
MNDAGAPVSPPAAVVERLRAARGFVFDMDGTLVLGDFRNHRFEPLPGALALTRRLARQGVPYAVLTNGTTRTPAQYAATLRGIGFDLDPAGMLTPVVSAIDVFGRRRQGRVLVLGTEALTGPLREAGFEVVPPTGRARADAVLVGWYREFTMAELESACHAVWDGAALYSCSQSIFFATATGRAIGTSRAISAMIRSLTGRRIEVVGKPSLYALRSAARRVGARPRDLAVVGDDPELEVPMAHRGGALAIAVGTGIGEAGAYDHLPPERHPHLSVAGVGDLLALF